MDRDAFLARVHSAAAAGRQYRVHTRPVASSVGYYGAGGDAVERFAAEAAAVGGQVQVVDHLDAARTAFDALLDLYAPRSALVWRHEVLDRLGLAALLESRGIEQHDYGALEPLARDEQRATMLAADIGLTSATWAVAETGSLVMASEPGRERAASLLPPVHVAVIVRDQIVDDLFDAFAKLGESDFADLPTNVTLITGPSKTGDLELTLVTGVHGPGTWHVIVVR